tara:strand:+ start:1390 stop:1626 length:237 start_codon:yes stop_codon:yes gene_type:complete
MRKKLNEWADTSKILHWFVILGFILAFMVSIFSCQEYYIGKSHEELAREMFEVDSLISKIQFMIDSLEVDGTKVWQDH